MNIILQNLIDNAQKRQDNNSAPPFIGKINTEPQDRPLPADLQERTDIPYGEGECALMGDVVYPNERGNQKLPVAVFVHGGALVTGDRKSDRVFCQEIARRGYVVYSLEYRLIDKADAFGMVSDVCEGLSMVKSTLHCFGGDSERVSLYCESAGAFLAIYATAAGRSRTLRDIFGCRRHGLKISHLILISGMIYSAAFDPVGLVYRKALYGQRIDDREFLKRIDPGNPKIISLLPPIFLVSSKADFLDGYTLKYANELKKNHHRCKLMYFKEGKELTHAFPALLPSLPESKKVLEAITHWTEQVLF